MQYYIAYGLQLASQLVLPGLQPGGDGSDLQIVLHAVSGECPAQPGHWYAEIAPSRVTIAHQRVGTIVVRDGCRIDVTPTAQTDAQLLPLILVGQALAYLLTQRGQLVLHASAVAVQGQALLFLGESGQGKSTTAALLAQRGHQLLSDDLAALDFASVPALLHPGSSLLKLSPSSAAALGLEFDQLQPLHDLISERGYHIPEFDIQPRRLAALFVLDDSPELGLERLPAHTAVIELLRHGYAAQYHQRIQPAEQLRLSGLLASQTPIYRLLRPRRLELLPALASLIEEQLCRAAVLL